MTTTDPEDRNRPADGSPSESRAAASPDVGSTIRHAGHARDDPEHPSWSNLVDKIKAFVEREFLREVRPPLTIEELQSDALQRVVHDLGRIELRDREQFWGWVRRLTQNALVDAIRRQQAQKRGGGAVVGLGAQAFSMPNPAGGSASVLAHFEEMQRQLSSCLEKIGQPTGDVLRLRLLEHRSHEEIQTALGFRRAVTVRARFARGLEQLRGCLAEHGFGIGSP